MSVDIESPEKRLYDRSLLESVKEAEDEEDGEELEDESSRLLYTLGGGEDRPEAEEWEDEPGASFIIRAIRAWWAHTPPDSATDVHLEPVCVVAVHTPLELMTKKPRSRMRATRWRKRTQDAVDAGKKQLSTSAKQDEWHRLCSTKELSCALTLASGQVFSWQKSPTTAEWTGVVGHRVFRLREIDEHVDFQCLYPSISPSTAATELSDYFRLEVDASKLYEEWAAPDDRMSQIIQSLPGLRIIRQDPVECLFSFICSSNNNIQRIQQMLTKLKTTYGTKLQLGPLDDSPPLEYYAFPSAKTLAKDCDEATLRSLGFGYRAAYITKTAKQLDELGGAQYLEDIRANSPSILYDDYETQRSKMEEDKYQDELMVFSGVGRKVADCVALFSLERLEAIPVDTHVWQIACREFDPKLRNQKSLTPTIYNQVGQHFRTRFRYLSGWAHSVLFAGDLPVFKAQIPAEAQKLLADEKKTQKKRKRKEAKVKSED